MDVKAKHDHYTQVIQPRLESIAQECAELGLQMLTVVQGPWGMTITIESQDPAATQSELMKLYAARAQHVVDVLATPEKP